MWPPSALVQAAPACPREARGKQMCADPISPGVLADWRRIGFWPSTRKRRLVGAAHECTEDDCAAGATGASRPEASLDCCPYGILRTARSQGPGSHSQCRHHVLTFDRRLTCDIVVTLRSGSSDRACDTARPPPDSRAR